MGQNSDVILETKMATEGTHMPTNHACNCHDNTRRLLFATTIANRSPNNRHKQAKHVLIGFNSLVVKSHLSLVSLESQNRSCKLKSAGITPT